ncbi:hypothetical protein [Nocardioides sp.]|uniref:hypothetical protein n=1 Tax=Nocardioides sp. TaxID=35761 RepID=UPI00260456AB|nr:hypothetical protein [Nocardioides sp.]
MPPGKPGKSGQPGDLAGFVLTRLLAAAAAILIVIVVAGFVLGHQASGPAAGWAGSTGHDGLWLGPGWLSPGGAAAPADTAAGRAQLATRIRTSGVADVYVPAGQVDASGQLAAVPRATSLLGWFHRTFPRVTVCAELTGAVGRGHLNLDDGPTQQQLVASARSLLKAGFTGISYDLSPVASGNPGLLTVLARTRALHPAVLAVDTPKLEPLAGMGLPAALLMRHPVFWTSGYLSQVASRVTQVAVLGFDTGVPLSSAYSGYVKHETSVALKAVPASVSLIMAVPANGGSNESVAATVHGARVALTSAGRQRAASFGLGLYTAGTATTGDWSAYQADWVRR